MKSGYGMALALGLTFFGTASGFAATREAPDEVQTVDQSGSISLTSAASAASAAAGSAAIAIAAQDSDDPTTKNWEVAFTPYLWVAGVNGDIGVPRGESVEIDKSFSDTLSDLKFAFLGALDVRRGRFVGLTDVIYLSVGAEAEGIRDPQFLEGEIDSSVFMGTGAVGYRVVDKGPLFVDVFAGGRVVKLKARVELEGPLQTREREASATNVAPLVGARVRVPLGAKWGLALYSDGSFTKSSIVKWQAIGTVQHELSRHWRLVAGYRYMSIDHSKRNLDFDVSLSGPIVGVTYRF